MSNDYKEGASFDREEQERLRALKRAQYEEKDRLRAERMFEQEQQAEQRKEEEKKKRREEERRFVSTTRCVFVFLSTFPYTLSAVVSLGESQPNAKLLGHLPSASERFLQSL